MNVKALMILDILDSSATCAEHICNFLKNKNNKNTELQAWLLKMKLYKEDKGTALPLQHYDLPHRLPARLTFFCTNKSKRKISYKNVLKRY